MRWIRNASIVTGALVAVLVGAGAPAEASANVGWLYTINAGGAVFFDADLNGEPGIEKITVCDNKSDGRGIMAEVSQSYWGGNSYIVVDPSNDGRCDSWAANFFVEDTQVQISVWEYAGTWSSKKVWAYDGVA
ncbi:hypothetical protein WEI85_12120 [Actinomycetes bacterium KLBMP 9797]